ncbi:MAG: exodeoxyribonuclease VII large subunit [Myxococcota bacterium]|nr:exodeoxyribonuclease VII large subunit [Myxococcota bacterium]
MKKAVFVLSRARYADPAMDVDAVTAVDQEKTYTVSALNREVRSLIEGKYDGVWVEAEISNVTRARSGHIYFSLVDPGGGVKAQLNAVMWQGLAARYGARIKTGTAVRCHGRLTLYEARGTYQLIADRVEAAGAGLKALALLALKEKLAKEGLFATDRKRPLPTYPSRIGVVTSRDGAAIRDIVKIAFRRFPVRIALAHAQVQGPTAPDEIAAALDRLASTPEVDVVIVGRGGGSADDLDAFNTETVVRAVAAHPVPVVSAVGHETDVTLADLAADRRAATPSEAAEIAVPDRDAVLDDLYAHLDRMETVMEIRVSAARERIAAFRERIANQDPRIHLKQGIETLAHARQVLARWPELVLTRARANLALAEEPLSRWPGPSVKNASEALHALDLALRRQPKPMLETARADLAKSAARLQALSPLASLSRGYAIVRHAETRSIVRDAAEAPPGTDVDITLGCGRLVCGVKQALSEPDPAIQDRSKDTL